MTLPKVQLGLVQPDQALDLPRVVILRLDPRVDLSLCLSDLRLQPIPLAQHGRLPRRDVADGGK